MPEPIIIQYRFTLPSTLMEEFTLELDPVSLVLKNALPKNPPEWAKAGFYPCENCPFSGRENAYCSVALNLVDIVSRFERISSYDEIFLEVITEERIYYKKTTAQRGVSSLIGLLIAASDCPLTDFFKPMARFHLPFATTEETIWRASATYLIFQYFIRKKGKAADLDLQGLDQIYRDIQKLNVAIVRRLKAACEEDSAVNAVIILDVFAKSLPLDIDKSLENIRPFFESLLRRMPVRHSSCA